MITSKGICSVQESWKGVRVRVLCTGGARCLRHALDLMPKDIIAARHSHRDYLGVVSSPGTAVGQLKSLPNQAADETACSLEFGCQVVVLLNASHPRNTQSLATVRFTSYTGRHVFN